MQNGSRGWIFLLNNQAETPPRRIGLHGPIHILNVSQSLIFFLTRAFLYIFSRILLSLDESAIPSRKNMVFLMLAEVNS